MKRMDTPRRLGGVLWVVAGTLGAAVWVVAGGTPGVVAIALTVPALIATAATLWRRNSALTWAVTRVLGIALGLDLLMAVADRFGLLGAPGDPGVSWGSWSEFVGYTGALVPWPPFPAALALGATVAEIVLGSLLITGHWWRWTGKLTAGLFFVYLVSLWVQFGWAEMQFYGMPVLVGAALLVSARGERPPPSRPQRRLKATATSGEQPSGPPPPHSCAFLSVAARAVIRTVSRA